MGNPTEEQAVFAELLATHPMFASVAVADWRQPAKDPPDIEVDLEDRRKIGIELTSWLDEEQISSEKSAESMERGFRTAIMPEPANETEHIWIIWLAPKLRLGKRDGPAFRSELLALVGDIDARWAEEPSWQSPQGFLYQDFAEYPMLSKYLESLDIQPRRPQIASTMRKGGQHWLTFPGSGGMYSPYTAVDALYDCVEAKIEKYSAKPPGMEEFHLLVHYDKAFTYNSPVHGIGFGYGEAVAAAGARIGDDVGVFDKIFVLVRITEGEKVFQLYP
jgi:hypothetical protein